MNIDLVKILPHTFFESAFCEKFVAFSTENKVCLYEIVDENDLVLVDQIQITANTFEFSKSGDILYISGYNGGFFMYDIKSQKLTEISPSGNVFGNILVMKNSECLWSSDDILYKYSDIDKRIFHISVSSYTIERILKATTEFVYLSAFIKNVFYILKVSFADMSVVQILKMKGLHKIRRVWYSQELDSIFIIKWDKILCLNIAENFKNESIGFKMIYKSKALKNARFLNESQKGNLIAFSYYKSLSVVNLNEKFSTVLIQLPIKSNEFVRDIGFLFNDRYIAVSHDNLDYGGKTCIYKLLNS